MRGRRLFVALLVAFAAAAAAPAEAYGTCPDKMLPSPAVSNADHQKDHNGNQVVCKHYENGFPTSGGPDDVQDDVI